MKKQTLLLFSFCLTHTKEKGVCLVPVRLDILCFFFGLGFSNLLPSLAFLLSLTNHNPLHPLPDNTWIKKRFLRYRCVSFINQVLIFLIFMFIFKLLNCCVCFSFSFLQTNFSLFYVGSWECLNMQKCVDDGGSPVGSQGKLDSPPSSLDYVYPQSNLLLRRRWRLHLHHEAWKCQVKDLGFI